MESKNVKKRKRLTKNHKHYVNNKEFTNEIIRCKKEGKLSDFAIECFIRIANRAIDKLYINENDREDLIQSALYDCIKYWKNFDETISNYPNAFAYFTQLCKNGYAKEYKKLHYKKGIDNKDYFQTVNIDYSGDSKIYTI